MPRKNKFQKVAEQINQIKSDFFMTLDKLKTKRLKEVNDLKQQDKDQELSDIRSKINQL